MRTLQSNLLSISLGKDTTPRRPKTKPISPQNLLDPPCSGQFPTPPHHHQEWEEVFLTMFSIVNENEFLEDFIHRSCLSGT